MRRVIVAEWMTLDGVVQAPMSADEDTSGGFRHGGWHLPFGDAVFQAWVVENVRGAGGFLLGRGTYDLFAAAPRVRGGAGAGGTAEHAAQVRGVHHARGAAGVA